MVHWSVKTLKVNEFDFIKTSLKFNFPPTLRVLDLSFSTNISRMMPAILKISQLNELILRESDIAFLPNKIFFMPHLYHLDISHTPIKQISRDHFQYQKRAAEYKKTHNVATDNSIILKAEECNITVEGPKVKQHRAELKPEDVSKFKLARV